MADLAVGDVIIRFNGVDVKDEMHLINLVSVTPIGKPSEVVVWRDRKATSIRVTIADRDAVLAKSALDGSRRQKAPNQRPLVVAADDLGLSLKPLDAVGRKALFGAGLVPKGVLVAAVDPKSLFASHLRPGDFLETINGKPIATPEDALKALRRPAGGPTLEVVVRRRIEGGGVQHHTLRVP